MKQKKSQIQFPVFETNSQNPRYHSNWQMPTHIAYKHMRHRVTVVVSVSSYSRSVSKLPSKVHSANPSIPQSHRLRLSVISLKCLLLFLNGFFYYPIYYSHSGNLSTVFFKNVREAGEQKRKPRPRPNKSGNSRGSASHNSCSNTPQGAPLTPHNPVPQAADPYRVFHLPPRTRFLRGRRR